MNSFFRVALICVGVTAAALPLGANTASAGLPRNALGAIAVSPDGKTIAAAGDNRVLYLVDAATLAVRERIWIGYSPMSLYWTRDGKTLALRHTDDVLLLYDTADWQVRAEIPAFKQLSIAQQTEKAVTMGQGAYKDGAYSTIVSIYDLNTGALDASATFDVEYKNIAASPDGSEIVLLAGEVDNEAEAKQAPADGLSGLEKEIAGKKGDGKTQDYVWLDGTLKQVASATSWYSTYYTNGLHIHDGKTYLLAYGTGAVIAGDGDAEMFKVENVNTNYGYVFAPDNSRMISGALAAGGILDLGSRSEIAFSLEDRLPSWPEYFQGFAVAPDGTVFGGTSAYRLMRMKPDGTVELVKPIY